MVIGALVWQSLPFFTVTVCGPMPTFGKVCGEVAEANAPPSSLIMYEPVPPPNVAVMVPLLNPLQVISVLDRLRVTAGCSVIVTDALFSQPLASLKVTVCKAGPKLLKTCGEVAATNAPASSLI